MKNTRSIEMHLYLLGAFHFYAIEHPWIALWCFATFFIKLWIIATEKP